MTVLAECPKCTRDTQPACGCCLGEGVVVLCDCGSPLGADVAVGTCRRCGEEHGIACCGDWHLGGDCFIGPLQPDVAPHQWRNEAMQIGLDAARMRGEAA